MNDSKHIWQAAAIAAVVAVAATLLVLSLGATRVANAVLTRISQEAPTILANVAKNTPVRAGAIAGPDISSEYLRWGLGAGVVQYATAIPFTAATNTPCAIQSPPATSTLRLGGVKLSVSSTTASTVTLAKSTSFNATTTWLTTESVAAGAQATIVIPATTTPTGMGHLTFAPSTWLVMGMAGGSGTFSPSGACHATFEVWETI